MSPVAINTEKPVRVLPADVYDTLELAAEAFGGIGCGRDYIDDTPCCVHGLARVGNGDGLMVNPLSGVLYAASIWRPQNDAAVRRINRRKGVEDSARVTFAEWCAELNVIRGD